jgi:hypothetical protein
MELARIELKVLLIALARDFDWTIVKEHPTVTIPLMRPDFDVRVSLRQY